MDMRPIQNAVDIAIATVASAALKWPGGKWPGVPQWRVHLPLCYPEHGGMFRPIPAPVGYKYHVQRVMVVETSQRIVEGLRIGCAPPDFDRLGGGLSYAAACAAWHQPKRINLAYTVLRALRGNGVKGGDIFGIANGRAHFVDYGCGALAMQFAIAIAAAGSIWRGRELREIRIDSYDPMRKMTRIGQCIWDEFARLMKLHYPKHPICEVFDLIQWKTHTELDTLPEATDAARFLSAIDAVYETTKNQVKDDLESLVSKYAPAGFLFATRESKRSLLSGASPIGRGDGYKRASIPNPKARFAGELDALTKMRRSLCDLLLDERKLPLNMNITEIDRGFVRDSLSKPVEWQYPNPAIVLYTRRDIGEFMG